MTITIDDQIACARRELALRKNCYPNWIQKGRLRRENADREIAAMSAILETLEKVKAEEQKELF